MLFRSVRVRSLPEDELQGIRNLRPAIDYGRCCWCALCVDLCPTGSISLSREYVHTCTDDELSSYFVLPDPNGMHKEHFGEGWNKAPENDLIDPVRQPMAELDATDISEALSARLAAETGAEAENEPAIETALSPEAEADLQAELAALEADSPAAPAPEEVPLNVADQEIGRAHV